MEIILLERIEKLGQMGDVVNVKPGYARNFLLPQKKAMRATNENRGYFEEQRAQLEAANLERRGEAEKASEKIDGLQLILVRQAGEAGQLYGSVSSGNIANAATDAGFTIERRQINLEKPIKVLGIHKVRVDLHPEVSVQVSVNVARSDEEAKTQAKTGKAVVSHDEMEKDKEKDVKEVAALDEDAAEEAFEAQAEQVFEHPEDEVEKHIEEIHEEAAPEAAPEVAKDETSVAEPEAPAETSEEGGESEEK